MPNNDRLTIALSAKWPHSNSRLKWIAENGFALEYSLDPNAFSELWEHVVPFLDGAIPVRFHAFFPGYEIGASDRVSAEQAVQVHLTAMEAISYLGESVMTVHIGLKPEIQLDHDRVVRNLSRLVTRGNELGVTICLENLRRGPTSNPEILAQWAHFSGSKITLDVGHMVSCQQTQSGAYPIDCFIEMLADLLFEVHMYERETNRHHPPMDMRILGPIVDRLVETTCRWWTIELDDCLEALATRAMLLEYLRTKKIKEPNAFENMKSYPSSFSRKFLRTDKRKIFMRKESK